jgi:hypothetical protein
LYNKKQCNQKQNKARCEEREKLEKAKAQSKKRGAPSFENAFQTSLTVP